MRRWRSKCRACFRRRVVCGGRLCGQCGRSFRTWAGYRLGVEVYQRCAFGVAATVEMDRDEVAVAFDKWTAQRLFA